MDAIESVRINQFTDIVEIIIINDGSTDNETINLLTELSEKGFNVINNENLGLAHSRNCAINNSNGKYILPLDSDNKIEISVFIEALNIMENNNIIDVVYTDAYFIGNKSGKWIVGDFNGYNLLDYNRIDACALIRKSTILESGLYDTLMPAMGSEDWDLWVRFFLTQKHFFYLPKIGFYYRVVETSMTFLITRPNFEVNKKYIFSKYYSLISKELIYLKNTNESYFLKIKNFESLRLKNKFKIIYKLFFNKQN
jgi:glycosyltransferase involved in cell wall biosynthesis